MKKDKKKNKISRIGIKPVGIIVYLLVVVFSTYWYEDMMFLVVGVSGMPIIAAIWVILSYFCPPKSDSTSDSYYSRADGGASSDCRNPNNDIPSSTVL
ncbi:MAG: hypothetical protein LBI53_07655 [Candidatus Peribacteria bacterium]|jgi:hypothetical protein|nr:hypothetical protein [Candidatus Peribacteria bacterium]